MGSNSKENQRRFAFNRQKFRKSRNKSPRVEKLEVEVPQANRSAENSDNSANKVQWNRDFPEDGFEKFVVTNNFVLPLRKNRQKTGPFTTWNFRIPKDS